MCLTVPARVLAVEDGVAVIELAGRQRRAATRLLADVAPGDLVLVGLGEILARLTPEEAASMADDLARVSRRPPANPTIEGERP